MLLRIKFLTVFSAALLLAGQTQAAYFKAIVFTPYAVSYDGTVVAGEFGGEAVRWTADDGMVGLGDLPGGALYSRSTNVSANGSVVVGVSGSASGWEAFRWSSNGGMIGLGSLPGNYFESFAFGVSADGSVVVGGSSSASGWQAFRWTADSGMAGLGYLPGGYPGGYISHATAVSPDGSVVVGGSSSASGYQVFRWTADNGMVGLGYLPDGYYGEASAISADGTVIVGQSSMQAFRWTADGGMVGLGYLPGDHFSTATGVSADGSVVVGLSESMFDRNAFIWNGTNGMQNLEKLLSNEYGIDLTGWSLYNAASISADGKTIVGWGIDPAGHSVSWIASLKPVPEPGTVLLLGTGLLGVGGYLRKYMKK